MEQDSQGEVKGFRGMDTRPKEEDIVHREMKKADTVRPLPLSPVRSTPVPTKVVHLPSHYAALHVTGWMREKKGRTLVQGLPVDLRQPDQAFMGQRVSMIARPRTDLWGNVVESTRVFHMATAEPRMPNLARFSALGKLRRVDLSEQMIILHVFRNGHGGKHFSVRVRATHTLLKAIPPGWPTLHVTGSLIGRMLVLEDFQPYPLHKATRPPSRWLDEWSLSRGLEPYPGLVSRFVGKDDPLRRSPSGRCYLRGKPFKAEEFSALLKAGYLWQREPQR